MQQKLIENDALIKLRKSISDGSRVISLAGLSSISAKSYVVNSLLQTGDRRYVIITGTNKQLNLWHSDLAFWSSQNNDKRILRLPSFETDIYSGTSPHAETQEQRSITLWSLANNDYDALIVSAKSLVTRTVKPSVIKQMGASIVRDEDTPPEELIEQLAGSGYVREDPINNIGQFSIRGGIVDVWPPNAANPFRIEFFGDTVDSIREFDAETQLSIAQVSSVSIAPMREFSANSEDMKDWAFFAREHFNDDSFARSLKDRTDFADEGETFSGWEFLLPLTKPLDAAIFDYLKDVIFIIDEPSEIQTGLTELYDNTLRRFEHLQEHGEIGLAPEKLFLSGTELTSQLESVRQIEMRVLGRSAAASDEEFDGSETSSPNKLFLFPAMAGSAEIEITSRSTPKFHGDLRRFIETIAKDAAVSHIIMQTAGLAERFNDILQNDLKIDFNIPTPAIGDLSAGFELPSAGISFFTESDIFGVDVRDDISSAKNSAPKSKQRLGAFISDFRDLKQGDYVVHVDHGIGRFDGLQTIASQGSEREFMLLVYAEKAKLFVPVERMDLVSRYSSGENENVSIDRLGGIGWQKTKAKAKRAMRDMADELLKLYAERKLIHGYAFSADTPWQKEFEDAFPYTATDDQNKAIDDVKQDMEAAKPMDRLIIGDVGYGKTEVAMRAAFKAVMDGKQAAILTPTTILAYQHFESFKKRFAAFPVKIDLLSRFRSASEQKKVAAAAEKGEVDIIIGTHRILSNDVKFQKLGLVVVDEEQRFGVAHKERLKQLKKKVDVLTLSATPIPRTLNMSLLGMRDMSIIETPPRDRLAINTQVIQFSESVIRSAIDVELARNGQVYFLHNRVETIEAIAGLIKKIVPDARIAIGHGQMNEKQMEQVMLDFMDYKYDVLVATTIIENGIDIPRANTIIINRADNYGLSQLYQLRGRVGRSNRRAYAYLLIPNELQLTQISRRRLSAIREFSDLGAGFRIAALDLELRGAGNILGGQQSGQLDALGFDLYTKMLERTIAEMRGEDIADDVSVTINLGVDVSIPKDYIVDTGQRLRTYKRISSAESEHALMQIRTEVEDRYGKIPDSVNSLFAYGQLRRLAEELRILSVDKTADGIAVKVSESSRISPEALMQFVENTEGSSFSANGILRVKSSGEDPVLVSADILRQITAK